MNYFHFKHLLSIRDNFQDKVQTNQDGQKFNHVNLHNNVLSTRLHFLGGLASAW